MGVYLKSRIWSFFSSSQFVIILTSMNYYDHFLEAEHPADMHPVSKLSQDQQDQQEIDQTTSNCPNVHLYRRRHNALQWERHRVTMQEGTLLCTSVFVQFCICICTVLHLYLYEWCNCICPSVQLYLHNMSGTATQWERRDKMNLLTPRSPLTSPDHWKLVILMRNGLFDQRMMVMVMMIMTIWSQHEESYDKNYADDVFISNVFHRDCFWILILSVLETVTQISRVINSLGPDFLIKPDHLTRIIAKRSK